MSMREEEDDDIEMADSDDELEEDEEVLSEEDGDDDGDDAMNDDGAAAGGSGGDGAAASGDGGGQQPPPSNNEDNAAQERRRAIQAIMRNTTLSEQDKRMQIQNLMSGGRTEVVQPPGPVLLSQQQQAPQPGGGVIMGGDPSQQDPTQQAQPGGAAPGAGGAAAAAAGGGANNNNAACVHYERNCNIVAPCCGGIFGCRICHDELSPTGHPPMDRFMVRDVVCKNCNCRQIASNQCIQCQTVFGEYHCGVCNLWMSMSKKPFHCQECGFCRVGGMEAFRHCHECCMCISTSVFETHQCFKDKYKNNCPVCREDMFSSRQSPQDLPCGHAIHAHCFRKLAGFDYRCPICKKTVVSQQSMAAAWEARARDIAEHPMPADLQRVVDIICNDCETKSPGRQWHFLGIQCPRCSSFNTVVEQVVSSGGADGTAGAAAAGGDQPGNNNNAGSA